MVRIKPGVQFTVILPAGFMILQALRHASKVLGVDLTITSACDGEHSGPFDPHHTGEAYDVRSHDLLPEMRAKVLASVMAELGWERFYGFLEAEGTSNAHFHIQRKKGTLLTVEDWLAL